MPVLVGHPGHLRLQAPDGSIQSIIGVGRRMFAVSFCFSVAKASLPVKCSYLADEGFCQRGLDIIGQTWNVRVSLSVPRDVPNPTDCHQVNIIILLYV